MTRTSSKSYVFYFKGKGGKKWTKKLETRRCTGTTRSNRRCKHRSVIGVGICHQHLKSEHLLCIKPSSISGLGLFALYEEKDNDELFLVFDRGDVIVPYDGIRTTQEEKDHLYGSNTAPYMIGGPDEDEFGSYDAPYFDASTYRSVGSIVNHRSGNDANAMYMYDEDTERIMIHATKKIFSGDEILCDYGDDYVMNDATFDTLKSNEPVPEWFLTKTCSVTV